jgi:hypothetical protein
MDRQQGCRPSPPEQDAGRGGELVLLAVAVVLLGIGIGFLGLLVPDLYAVGVVVLFIGAIGVLVRSVDWYRWIRETLKS